MSTTTRKRAQSNAPTPPAPLSAEQITAWLDYAIADLITRRTEVVTALTKTARAFARIDSDADQGVAVENAQMGKALIAAGEKRRVPAKDPFLNGGRAVDAYFKAFAAPIAAALQPVEQLMLDYAKRKAAAERAKAEEARKAAQEAARQAEEAARAAQQAAPFSEAADDAVESALVAAEIAAHAVEIAAAKPAQHSRVVGVYGASAGLRTTWDFDVEDITKVPSQYLCVDAAAVREQMKRRDPQTGRPLATIPGIRWVENQSLAVRR